MTYHPMMDRTLPATIGPMTADDIDAVVGIEMDSFSSPWSREQFVQELVSPVSFCLVARDLSGSVAGYICLMFVLDECTVMDIAVSPRQRGEGLGRRLLQTGLDECRRRCSNYVHLEVRVSALPAIALYRSAGFVETGRRPRYYRDGEDALLMTLHLQEEGHNR